MALRFLSSTARFRPWIPSRPPLNAYNYQETGYRHPWIGFAKCRKKMKSLFALFKICCDFFLQLLDPANISNCDNGQNDAAQHCQNELNKIGYNDAPHSACRTINPNCRQQPNQNKPVP